MLDMENVLYYGDNLDILRRYVKDAAQVYTMTTSAPRATSADRL